MCEENTARAVFSSRRGAQFFCTQNWYMPEKVSGYFVSTSCQRSRSASDQPAAANCAQLAQKYRQVEFETDETQSVLADEILDHRDRHARLVHVKEQIAALARREKIGEARDACERRCEKLLPAATDLCRASVPNLRSAMNVRAAATSPRPASL